MRKKVRGLRGVEQSVLNHRRDSAPVGAEASPSPSIVSGVADRDDPPPVQDDPAGDVVLDYCAAVRGILNDDQGGPLHPPGLRMAEALGEVRTSLQRNLDAKKGGAATNNCVGSPAASTGGCKRSPPSNSRSGSTPTRSRASRQR